MLSTVLKRYKKNHRDERHMTEDQLEQETLAWLAGLGYTRLPSLISGHLRVVEAVVGLENLA